MQKRAGLLTVFSIFFGISIVIILLFRQQVFPVTGTLFEILTYPIQNSISSAFGGLTRSSSGYSNLKETNRSLAKQLVDQRELEKEAKALRDQYDLEIAESKTLMPSTVIGFKSFIPGVSLPEEIILDRGSKQGVTVGQTVVLTNNVVGKIERVSTNRSLVLLITNKKQSLTAKANKTDALGIIKGKGNGMITFENVVLADKLEKDDVVVTQGDEDLSGAGYPPDLVIGRIVSVDKKASDLFQTAEIESLIDFSRLDKVFILTGSQ